MHNIIIKFKQLVNANIVAAMAIFLILFCWSAYSLYILNQSPIYSENGLLENIQVFVLFIACFAFILPIIFQNRTDKLILLFFGLLCYSFILREIDVEDLNIPNILKLIGSGAGRNIILATGFIAMLVYFIFNITHYKNVLRSVLTSRFATLIIMGGVGLYTGDVFENMYSIQHHVFLEEISELFGYVFILLSAFTYSENV